jgi:hypothetical protein
MSHAASGVSASLAAVSIRAGGKSHTVNAIGHRSGHLSGMTRGRSARWLRLGAALIVLFGLIQPLSLILQYPDRLSVFSSLQVDAALHDEIARDIVNSGSLGVIPPLQPPGFVGFLAAVYATCGSSWVAAKLALWSAFVALTIIGAIVARQMYESDLAMWVAAIVISHSSALQAYVTTLQYDVPTALLLLAFVYGSAAAARASNPREAMKRYVLLGLVGGSCILMREATIAAVVVCLGYVIVHGRRWPGYDRRLATALLIALSLAPGAGWSAYQSVRTGRIVPLTDKGAMNLRLGNNPTATGTFNAANASDIPEPAGVAFFAERPTAAARLIARKFGYFWGLLRDGWNVPRPAATWVTKSSGGIVPLEFLLPLARGGLVFALVCIGLLRWSRAQWLDWWHAPAVIVVQMSVHLISISSFRYALPIWPVALLIATGPLSDAARWFVAKPRRLAAVSFVLLAAGLMQLSSSRMQYVLPASELDSGRVSVVTEPDGAKFRHAAPADGPQVIALLADEYLAAGKIQITALLRSSGAESADQVVATVWLRGFDGRTICRLEVPHWLTNRAEFSAVSFDCTLQETTVATMAIESTARAAVDLRQVIFQWR